MHSDRDKIKGEKSMEENRIEQIHQDIENYHKAIANAENALEEAERELIEELEKRAADTSVPPVLDK